MTDAEKAAVWDAWHVLECATTDELRRAAAEASAHLERALDLCGVDPYGWKPDRCAADGCARLPGWTCADCRREYCDRHAPAHMERRIVAPRACAK